MGSSSLLLLLLLVGTARCQRKDQNVCRKDNGLFEHEQYCDYYYECEDGVPTLQLCPNGLAFSGKNRGLLNNCDYPHRVGCPDDDGRVMGQSPQSSENCHWQYGVFAHQTSCTRYWQCWNGTATIQQCPFSLLYNDVMHACDWPDNVPDCQKHPICKDNPNGHIPIEKSCVRYWLCVGGYPRLQRCPAGLAFSPTALRCELTDNIPGCELPPTTPQPEEAEERPQQQRPRPQQQAARPAPPQAAPSGQRRFSPPPQSVPALAQASPIPDQDDDYSDAGQNRAQGVVRRPAAFRQAAPASTGK
ncbi:protein obstructor-E [Dermacentor silvarum]|uniref:protein obstructor-E n=1 Tax=Dermacentor silvarum TaxID=543639 RepID=UPI00189B0F6B|nr:protein obstructor-E [Dermacentor silvarum]